MNSHKDYPWLPIELYVKILQQLPLTEQGILTVCRCALASKSLYEASRVPNLWKLHYDIRYSIFDEGHEKSRRSQFGDDWRALYLIRRGIEQKAHNLLKYIIRTIDYHGRNQAARKIVVDYGLDIWDDFKLMLSFPRPVLLQDEADVDKVKNGLPILDLSGQFWISEILGVIARRRTMDLWGHLTNTNSRKVVELEVDAPIEDAFLGLASFWDTHPTEIRPKLDALAVGCKHYLQKEQIPYDPMDNSFNTAKLCIAISKFMRIEGYDATEDGQFYHFFNSFPNFYLFSRKRSLPISLAFIFVSIVRRLGLPAILINSHFRVIARVREAFVDVFGPPELAIVDTSNGFLDSTYSQESQCVTAREMLVRTARNIWTACDVTESGHDHLCITASQRHRASYTLQYIGTVIRPSDIATIDQEFLSQAVHHPLDCSLVLRDKLDLPPASDRVGIYENGDTVDSCLDIIHRWEIQYTEELLKGQDRQGSQVVSFFVGQIVRDAQGSIGCIVGWTSSEDVAKRTLLEHFSYQRDGMIIDGQTTYKILLVERQYRLYEDISEGHLVPIEGREPLDFRPFLAYDMLGFYFKDVECYEVPESGLVRSRFIMSDAMMQIFPDDEEYGSRWMRSSS